MSVQTWSIILNSVIVVLIVGYGVWLKYIIKHQLGTKDTAIEALEAGIKSKDAEISALKGNTAPAIAKQYNEMKKYASHVTEESQRINQQLETLNAQYEVTVGVLAAETEFLQKMTPFERTLAENDGLLLASGIMFEHLGRLFMSPEPPEISFETIKALFEGLMNAGAQMQSEVDTRMKELASLSDGLGFEKYSRKTLVSRS